MKDKSLHPKNILSLFWQGGSLDWAPKALAACGLAHGEGPRLVLLIAASA